MIDSIHSGALGFEQVRTRLKRSTQIVYQRATRVAERLDRPRAMSSRMEGSNGLSFDRRTNRPAIHLDGTSACPEMVQTLVAEAYERFGRTARGKIRRSIRRSRAYRATVRHLRGRDHGRVSAAGDTDHAFTIMSVSKPFIFALVCELIGAEGRAKSSARTPQACRSTRWRPSTQGGRPHEPDGQCGRDRDDQPGAGRDAENGSSFTMACRGLPGASCR